MVGPWAPGTVTIIGTLADEERVLLGLDINSLSVAWPAIPELKKLLREVRVEDARAAARKALAAPSAAEVTECLAEGMGSGVDLEAYRGRWNLRLPT